MFKIILILLSTTYLFPQNVNHYSFLGDCSSTIDSEKFFQLNYLVVTSSTTRTENINYSMHNLCDTIPSLDSIKIRFFTSTFTSISNNSNTYSLDTDLAPKLVYSNYSSSNSFKEHIIEFEDKLNGNALAIDYGSFHKNNDVYLSYMFSLDSLNNYESDYQYENITYNTIFDRDSTFFIEILTDSIPVEFVGYKYKSSSSSTTFEKYFVPK